MSSQPKKTILTVSGLSFGFEIGCNILNDISFNLYEDETVLVLGPSGSGKSTLAYCLNNLYPSSVDGILEGSIQFRGRSTSSFIPGEINQKIGLVLQDPDAQFCMLTVEDELAFVLENIQTPRVQMAEKIDWALDLVDMRSMKQRMIHSLSGGQKQKLAIASALAMEPELLILDEPTANLDPVSSMELTETLKNLKQKYALSILVIEHNLDNWIEMIDRCVILNAKGHLIFDGNPNVCFSKYTIELAKEGIWLPRTVSAACKFKEAGLISSSAFPLTVEQLIDQLDDPEEAIALLKNKKTATDQPGKKTIFYVDQLAFSKANTTILSNLSFSIAAGEFIAIAGANGSGKTTFTRCLTGLLPISAGEISFDGVSLQSWREEEKWRRIGYVFQNPEHQFITDSVYEEIQYSLNLGSNANGKIKEIANRLNLSEHLYQHPFSLSQGQKRRLSVAVMLINDQQVLILDEPTFGQDAITSSQIIEWVTDSVTQSGCVMMITHDMDLIDRYADKVMVMHKGSELFFGTPDELWQNEKILSTARLKLPFRKEVEKIMKKDKGERYAVK
jgi:energy-coupling factor transport system ATP-binding protein